MFPLDEIIKTTEDASNERELVAELGQSIRFDLSSRSFVLVDGKPDTDMTDEEKVQQWFELLINTQPERFGIYKDSGFGVDTEGLIGYRSVPKSFVYAEFKRELEESCNLNPIIEYLYDFSVEKNNGVLCISFAAHLYTGDSQEVSINV